MSSDSVLNPMIGSEIASVGSDLSEDDSAAVIDSNNNNETEFVDKELVKIKTGDNTYIFGVLINPNTGADDLGLVDYLKINLNLKNFSKIQNNKKFGLDPRLTELNGGFIRTKGKTTGIIQGKFALVSNPNYKPENRISGTKWTYATPENMLGDIYVRKQQITKMDDDDIDKLKEWLAAGADKNGIQLINDMDYINSANTKDNLFNATGRRLFTNDVFIKNSFDFIKQSSKEDDSKNAMNDGVITRNGTISAAAVLPTATSAIAQEKKEENVNPLTAGFIVTCEQKTLNNNFDLNVISVKYQNPKDTTQEAKIIELLVPINLTGADNTIQTEVLKHLKFILDFLYIFKSSPKYNDLIENVFLETNQYDVSEYTEEAMAISTGLDKSLFGALIFPQIVSLLQNIPDNVLIGSIGNVKEISDFGKVVVYFKAHIMYVKIMITLAYYIAKFNLTMNNDNTVTLPPVPTTTPTTDSILVFIKALEPATDAATDATDATAATATAAATATTAATDAVNNVEELIKQLATIKKYLTEITPTPTLGGGYPKKRRNRGKQSKRKRVRRRMTEKREV